MATVSSATNPVKKKLVYCVSKGILSPLTAKEKSPHYGRKSEFESEAVKAVASSQDVLGEVYFGKRGN